MFKWVKISPKLILIDAKQPIHMPFQLLLSLGSDLISMKRAALNAYTQSPCAIECNE